MDSRIPVPSVVASPTPDGRPIIMNMHPYNSRPTSAQEAKDGSTRFTDQEYAGLGFLIHTCFFPRMPDNETEWVAMF